jgi:mxaC protein
MFNISFYFNTPWVLLTLPLALLPLILNRHQSQSYPSVSMLPKDRLSEIIGLLLKIISVLALVFIIIGIAGPHSQQQQIERIGVGAQIGLVLDRSASMDDPFSGENANGKVGETKSVAASRLITEFINSRQNDMFGMITFSNSAMYVLPLTENKNAVLAAVQATAGNALFQTNIGSGLTSVAGLFDKVPDSGSRAVILLSDGGGRIDANTQQKIRDWFDRLHLSLYWIVLRQPGGLSIFDTTYVPPEDTALPPQIELNEFFKTFNTPFSAYEAEDPKSLAAAIASINQKEKKPIRYKEQIAGKNFTHIFYLLAAIMLSMLIAIKLIEVRTWD